ncbi:hypothetical protein [Nocardiopsis sp. MG754419]|uniref:hypothetical protein n=1 Tax=Nocardiopsis sp. MG754419 TaxID=2259865 RepID=UPI001BACC901|nr:hypothetical protein [Nocardiopsis sp. MG754419]MBR8745235.1 hypothetical protein [Nocardiopsis sp. MG754419]
MNFTPKSWADLGTMVKPTVTASQDTGAGFVEYGAIIVFVGLVAAALYGSGIGDTIIQGITSAVGNIFNGAGSPESAPVPAPLPESTP